MCMHMCRRHARYTHSSSYASPGHTHSHVSVRVCAQFARAHSHGVRPQQTALRAPPAPCTRPPSRAIAQWWRYRFSASLPSSPSPLSSRAASPSSAPAAADSSSAPSDSISAASSPADSTAPLFEFPAFSSSVPASPSAPAPSSEVVASAACSAAAFASIAAASAASTMAAEGLTPIAFERATITRARPRGPFCSSSWRVSKTSCHGELRSRWSKVLATSSAVWPCALCASGSAPASRRSSTISTKSPFHAAIWSGNEPFSAAIFGSALRAISKRASRVLPACAAQPSGVLPYGPPRSLTSALSSKTWTWSSLRSSSARQSVRVGAGGTTTLAPPRTSCSPGSEG
mmetsp:Transcript_53780/g.128881  ORF Transcript_53780/g.128881 Transcript_53780/m.128881 type:complete len:345 (+) Transcript_53780:121-1155(+)